MLPCTEGLLKIYDIIKTVIMFVRIAAPIMLVVAGTANFMSAVLNPDTKSLPIALALFKKMAIAALCVFMVPTLINIILTATDSSLKDGIFACDETGGGGSGGGSGGGGTGGETSGTETSGTEGDPGGIGGNEEDDEGTGNNTGGGSDKRIVDPALSKSGEGQTGDEGGTGGGGTGDGDGGTGGETTTPITPTDGVATSEFGAAIAAFALQLYNNNKNDWRYISPSLSSATQIRANTYNNILTNGKYTTDCNGFVGFVVNRATGLGVAPGSASSKASFTTIGPNTNDWSPRAWAKNCVTTVASRLSLDQALSQAQPGDLLGATNNGQHAMIYVGNGEIVDLAGDRITKRPSDRAILHPTAKYTILRVTSNTCH